MAVYTEVTDNELEAFVAEYDIGEIKSCKGIAEGVENSNYLLHTDRGNFIMTLYEKRVDADDLPFFMEVMTHLASKGMSCWATHARSLCGSFLMSACIARF